MKTVSGILNICRKAGYLIIGGENIRLNQHKMYLILIDKTAGNSLKREMSFSAKTRNIPLVETENLAEILGIDNLKALAVKNKALSEEILKLLKGE